VIDVIIIKYNFSAAKEMLELGLQAALSGRPV